MSQSTAPTQTQAPEAKHAHGHDHPPHLAHHFKDMGQQFASGKLGMWIFLATEILMFGGLFCAYAIYRGIHKPVFDYAHGFLDTRLGALNTVILITSSFTMAWGVRAAQLGQKKLLNILLVLTLLGGVGFLAVKSVEYGTKFSHGLWPGYNNLYYGHDADNPNPEQLAEIHHLEEVEGYTAGHGHGDAHAQGEATASAEHADQTAAATTAEEADQAPAPAERSLIEPAAVGPTGTNLDTVLDDAHDEAADHLLFTDLPPQEQERVHLFFQIYYLMTGLHTIHVIIGMGVILWLIIKSFAGTFGPEYFTPVDIVGLYWHLVDLIWIFLFPLLYLIQ